MRFKASEVEAALWHRAPADLVRPLLCARRRSREHGGTVPPVTEKPVHGRMHQHAIAECKTWPRRMNEALRRWCGVRTSSQLE